MTREGRRKSAFTLKLVERLVTSSQMQDSPDRWDVKPDWGWQEENLGKQEEGVRGTHDIQDVS